jgi:HNH endonuclease
MRKKTNVDYDIASKRIQYNAENGSFVWLVSLRGHTKAGNKAGSISSSTGYIEIGIGGRKYGAHRLAWLLSYGEWPENEVDHINGIRTDNRLSNLRSATSGENKQNQRQPHKDSLTGYLGVSKNGKRFSARIQLNGKFVYVGTFDTAEQASNAYLAKKREVHAMCAV